jgi:hypothetical protein
MYIFFTEVKDAEWFKLLIMHDESVVKKGEASNTVSWLTGQIKLVGNKRESYLCFEESIEQIDP